MNEVKTWEVFEEIAALLRSVRNNNPEDCQFHPAVLKTIADKTKTAPQDIETILIALSTLEQ